MHHNQRKTKKAKGGRADLCQNHLRKRVAYKGSQGMIKATR
jgi:hypothetical protein